jgi:hypothetical protein
VVPVARLLPLPIRNMPNPVQCSSMPMKKILTMMKILTMTTMMTKRRRGVAPERRTSRAWRKSRIRERTMQEILH